MNSIIQLHFSSSSLLPLNSHHNQKSLALIRQNKQQLPFLAAMTRRSVQQSEHSAASTRQVMGKALPHSSPVLIAASSSPKPLDMPLFLQTSALLLFLYFTANFIVPELISKYFEFDKVNEGKNVNDSDR